MAIYVDDVFVPARIGAHQSRWCHLMTDGEIQGLHAFARSIGAMRSWFHPHERLPHYDVPEDVRKKAVAAGAIEIGSEDRARLMTRGARPQNPDAKG